MVLHLYDTLNKRLNYLTYSESFPNINNTYTELVYSGKQSLIQDPYLSTDIIGVYLFCEKCEISMKTIVKIYSIRIFSLFLITHIK
jgi:hypothetical protein